MKDIATLLGLKEDASVQEITSAISNLKSQNTSMRQAINRLETALEESTAHPQKTDREKTIERKIVQSGGALNREQAEIAIDLQAEEDAKRKAKK